MFGDIILDIITTLGNKILSGLMLGFLLLYTMNSISTNWFVLFSTAIVSFSIAFAPVIEEFSKKELKNEEDN